MLAVFGGDSLLPRHERETFTQLKQKLLQFVNQPLLQFALAVGGVLLEVKKFQNIRVFEDVVRISFGFELEHLSRDFRTVSILRGKQTLIVKRVYLPL